jgi:RNA polymerase sigma factor (sigma-70 family)
MAADRVNRVILPLVWAALGPDGAGSTDRELLEQYVACRDEAAFAALLRRHGPMVLGVCRRVLRNQADAEDAFQATFLVLVRKAAAIRSGNVGSWLYGVAHNTALKALAMNRKRRTKEREAGSLSRTRTAEPGWCELQALLDTELSRLPDRYRAPLVLCDLVGKTIKEAARHLGWPQGTAATRLARGRALLARRLAKHGPIVSAGIVTAAFAHGSALASVTSALVHPTIQAAMWFAAARGAAIVSISTKVVALTEGVLQAMFLNKLQSAIGVLLLLAAIGLAASGLAHRTQAADPPEPLSPSALRKQEDSNLKETVLALEKRIWEAYRAQDRAAFRSLLADDFEGVNPRGYPFDKAGELKYASNFCTTESELKDARVILLTPNSALVTYEVHYKVRPAGARKIIENTTSHRTAAWAQRNGKWWRVYVEDRVAQKEGTN